jgi:hypothetical protein
MRYRLRQGMACLVAACAVLLPRYVFAGLVDIARFTTAVYAQQSAVPPTVADGYFLSIGGRMTDPADFHSATVAYPGVAALPVTFNSTTFNRQSSLINSLTALHNSYPFGTYTITAKNSITQATQSASINYTSDPFPNIPSVPLASLNKLLNFNPLLENTISFNPYNAPQGDESYVFVDIIDVAANKSAHGANFLPTSTSTVTIPANTLASNTSYRVSFTFSLQYHDTSNGIPTHNVSQTQTYINFKTLRVPEPATLGSVLLGAAVLLLKRHSKTIRGSTTA